MPSWFMITSRSKPKVLLCGHTLIADQALQRMLSKKFHLYLLAPSQEVESMVIQKNIALLVFELSANWEPEVERLRELMVRFKKLCVLMINGNNSEEAIVKVFHYGATDVFRKPYSKELLVERIEALIQQQL